MDAILFSANPHRTEVDDGIRHLADHKELYWSVGFQIARDKFTYPMYGFMHISGEQVEYRATVSNIVPFEAAHYNRELKPEPWVREWNENQRPYKNSLVITEIAPFSYDTCSLKKQDGTAVQGGPEGYVRILPPDHMPQSRPYPAPPGKRPLAETNLEDFVIQQLETIEPGLHLVERQLSTPAGRLDLLCRDAVGSYVVVELKRMQGSDQVVGQILRYMGWLKETHPAEKVRGIVIVGNKDQALLYAARAVPDVQVKEFKLQIQ
jgi:endonuclease NucS-like protein